MGIHRLQEWSLRRKRQQSQGKTAVGLESTYFRIFLCAFSYDKQRHIQSFRKFLSTAISENRKFSKIVENQKNQKIEDTSVSGLCSL